jgi:hypothetical protein
MSHLAYQKVCLDSVCPRDLRVAERFLQFYLEGRFSWRYTSAVVLFETDCIGTKAIDYLPFSKSKTSMASFIQILNLHSKNQSAPEFERLGPSRVIISRIQPSSNVALEFVVLTPFFLSIMRTLGMPPTSHRRQGKKCTVSKWFQCRRNKRSLHRHCNN